MIYAGSVVGVKFTTVPPSLDTSTTTRLVCQCIFMVYGVCASATTENIDIRTDIGRLVVVTALSPAWPAGDGPEASLSGRDASFGRRVAAKATGEVRSYTLYFPLHRSGCARSGCARIAPKT